MVYPLLSVEHLPRSLLSPIISYIRYYIRYYQSSTCASIVAIPYYHLLSVTTRYYHLCLDRLELTRRVSLDLLQLPPPPRVLSPLLLGNADRHRWLGIG